MRMPSESGGRFLFDTNVLVYAANTAVPQHAASLALRNAAIAGKMEGCVTTHILFEYVAVISSPKRVPNPVSAEAAWNAAEKIASVFTVFHPAPDIVSRSAKLGRTLGVGGARVFDLMIALTSIEHGVSSVYSFDTAVFSLVPGVTVHIPGE
jgi:uncharacterized protein